ncbi:sigma 54-interacting transcriptional regulator [Anaerospora hongkongensis]|uniref:sigma 54-interacting transcriptional regulator n=1 Tax=Anaerospora hongkongensis TaxID=244830 RepID=UPI0028A0685F|nr:sigma 54-interacting transcriptional regulator [Anaerospora hongkongensis]
MINVSLVAPYEECKQLAEAVATESREMNVLLQIVSATGVKIIEKLYFDCDAIIARGVTASALQTAYPHIPVINLPVTGYDVINAVMSCRKQFNAQHIAIMGSDSMIYGVQNISGALGVEIQCYRVMEEEDAEQCVKTALASGADAIISGAMTVEIAKRYGLNAVLIESGKEAILQALGEAVRTARVAKHNQEIAERVKAIMDHAYEGVLAIDEKGYVTVFNKTAEAITKVSAQKALGRHIRSVLPNTGLLRILETGEAELGDLETISGALVVKNRVPVKVKDKVVGAVATFQHASKLQELEGRIREKIHYTGLKAKYSFPDIIGTSTTLTETIEMTRKFSKVDSNILLIGETGTGKELFAQSCHNNSLRRKGPFMAVNCAALPENLLESELFGYVPGAFTGAAKSGKPGLFELAHQGTIFLDEVSEIPLKLQGRLLRVLQEREIMRLGDDRIIPVDVRVISATNKDLKQLDLQNAFRRDLLYRLDVLHIHVPPLRARQGDILLLVEHFLTLYTNRFHKNPVRLSPAAERLLTSYNWPGNVRELCNVCERLAVLAEGAMITEAAILRILSLERTEAAWEQENDSKAEPAVVDKKAIHDALQRAGGNKMQAARLLGISRTTLWRKLALPEDNL